MTQPAPSVDEQLDAAIRSAFADIVAAADRESSDSAGDVRPGAEVRVLRRGWLTVAAAALLLAGAGGLVLASRQADPGGMADSSVGSVPMTAPGLASGPFGTTPTAGPAATTTAQGRDTLVWERAVDTGSIERSSVDSIVANTLGFVATGMGFDDGRNQGRVWHSADGMSWTEPAFDLFDAKAVFGTAASDDAFYVLAATNADRTPQNEGEGIGSLEDAQIYRSTDGITWSPWGQENATTMGIAASGDHLLRQTAPNRLEWTTDGDTWTASTFSDGADDITLLDVNSSGLIDGEVTYLRGFRGDANTFTVWASRDHGQTWDELPPPPAGGFMVQTPDGLLISYNPDEQRCNQVINDAFEDFQSSDSGTDSDAHLDASWNCAAKLGAARFDSQTNTWNVIDAAGPGPTPSLTATVRLGDTLVTPILEPGKALTVWTASLDANDWVPDPTTTLQFIANTGSPSLAPIAATDQRIVIASPDRIVNGNTVLLVGTPN